MLLALLSSIGGCPPKMVLISEGRSGSSATLSAIQMLTHSPHSFGSEILGSNAEQMAKSNPTSIMEAFYRHTCKEHPGAALMGFKLKPYIDFEPGGQLREEKWRAAFAWLRENNVSVVMNTRNLMDRMISGATYDLVRGEMGKHLSPHCTPQDTKCIDDHLNAHVDMPTGSTLLARLRENRSPRVAKMLHIYNFRHLRVNYEDLFLADSENRSATWRRVVQFLQPERMDVHAISESDVARALNLTAKTSPSHQRDKVTNYDDVVSTLTGTEFEPLLHRRR